MPRVKELVSILAASKNHRECEVKVEQALDKLISDEKANIASEKPSPIGGVVSSCPVKKTKISAWLSKLLISFFLMKRQTLHPRNHHQSVEWFLHAL